MKAEYVDHMGSDLSVVNAARVSFDKVSTLDCKLGEDCCQQPTNCYGKLREEDVRLIKFLAKHDHWTPFAHTAISLRMSAPVPIRTQCFKHKQGLVENEESRRYISSVPELYSPKVWREAASNAKQGSGDPHDIQDDWAEGYDAICYQAIDFYLEMIEAGVCPEQARFVLPQGCIVNWVWTGNLFSFANFYRKRTDPHAQREVAELATMVGAIIEPLFPVSWKALTHD